MQGIAGAFLTLLNQAFVGGMWAMDLVPPTVARSLFYRSTAGVYLAIAGISLWIHGALAWSAVETGRPWGDALRSPPGAVGVLLLVYVIGLLGYLTAASGRHPAIQTTVLRGLHLVGLAVLWLPVLLAPSGGAGMQTPVLLASQILSACLLGLSVTGMLFGHWYLNEPGLPPALIRRLSRWFLIAILVAFAFPLAQVGLLAAAGSPGGWHRMAAIVGDHPILVAARFVAGLGGSLAVGIVIRDTLRIPNVQSATGFYYIAILTILVGEIAGRALLLYTGLPL